MIFIKLFLLTILTLSFLLFAFSMRLKNMQRLGVIFGYFVLFVFIVNPPFADKVAHLVGIYTGSALVVYLTLAVLSLVNVILFLDTKTNNDAITQIVRQKGLEDARRM